MPLLYPASGSVDFVGGWLWLTKSPLEEVNHQSWRLTSSHASRNRMYSGETGECKIQKMSKSLFFKVSLSLEARPSAEFTDLSLPTLA